MYKNSQDNVGNDLPDFTSEAEVGGATWKSTIDTPNFDIYKKPAMHFEQTADSDTVLPYQVSSVRLVIDK